MIRGKIMKISDAISKCFFPYATKIGNQRNFLTIRDSFIDITPIIMVNSVFILLNSLVFGNATLLKQFPYFSKSMNIGTMANAGTLGFMIVFVTFLIGYRLTKYYIIAKRITADDLSPLHSGIISVAVTLIMFPL